MTIPQGSGTSASTTIAVSAQPLPSAVDSCPWTRITSPTRAKIWPDPSCTLRGGIAEGPLSAPDQLNALTIRLHPHAILFRDPSERSLEVSGRGKRILAHPHQSPKAARPFHQPQHRADDLTGLVEINLDFGHPVLEQIALDIGIERHIAPLAGDREIAVDDPGEHVGPVLAGPGSEVLAHPQPVDARLSLVDVVSPLVVGAPSARQLDVRPRRSDDVEIGTTRRRLDRCARRLRTGRRGCAARNERAPAPRNRSAGASSPRHRGPRFVNAGGRRPNQTPTSRRRNPNTAMTTKSSPPTPRTAAWAGSSPFRSGSASK